MISSTHPPSLTFDVLPRYVLNAAKEAKSSDPNVAQRIVYLSVRPLWVSSFVITSLR